MCFNGKGVVAFHETSQMLWKDPIKENCYWRGRDHKNQHRLSTKNTDLNSQFTLKDLKLKFADDPLRM